MPDVTADSARGDAAAGLPWGWRIASWIATAIGIVLLGYVIALWGWRWLGPPPAVVAPPAPPERWTPAIVAAPLFGRAGAPQPVDSGAPATLQGDTRLLGVFAEADGAGYALVSSSRPGPGPRQGGRRNCERRDAGRSASERRAHPRPRRSRATSSCAARAPRRRCPGENRRAARRNARRVRAAAGLQGS